MTRKVGFIPLRKGSKGILNKNRRKMAGRPLFCWVLTEAIFSDLDTIYIYTDDDIVRAYVDANFQWTDKVRVMQRGEDTATDEASTESAIVEFCEKVKYDFSVFCLLQATSPMTTADDINRALARLDEGYDSALSVVRTHRFSWSEDGNALNYDPAKRPRRQDFDGMLIENGAVYATAKKVLIKNKNRISGSIGLVEMDIDSYHEIDEENDWQLVESLLLDRLKRNKSQARISHIVLDVDGVFTSGHVSYSEDGELSKAFDMRDGMGLEIIRELGVTVMVMTSENSPLVASRMQKLNIEHVFLGVKDKYSRMQRLFGEMELTPESIAYIGDDVNDLATMCTVGWSMAPNNAMDVIKRHADMVLNKPGGGGAIREACEFIMKYNKRYE